nr:MAG TPA: hypothetical protein [Bacteriophage sp.]
MLCIVVENARIYRVLRFGNITENLTELLSGLK